MKKPPTKAECIRLTVEHWIKLRELMQKKGRTWLERAIDREHRKIAPKQPEEQ